MMYPRRETVLFRLLVTSASLSLSLHLRMWIPARAARTLAGSKKTSGVFYHVACESLIKSGIDLRVWHIPGSMNIVADAISRQMLSVVYSYVPGIHIVPFQPPRFALGARQQ